MRRALSPSVVSWIVASIAVSSAVAGDPLPPMPPSMAESPDRLERIIERLMRDLETPGLAAIILQDQQVVWERGFGYADRERRVEVTPDTPFGLASVTKPLASVVFFRAADVSVALCMTQSLFGLGQAEPASVAAMFGSIDVGVALGWLAVLTAIALAFPNTQQILRKYWFSSDPEQKEQGGWPAWLAWRPSPAWAVACAVIILASLGSISGNTEFIYYKF